MEVLEYILSGISAERIKSPGDYNLKTLQLEDSIEPLSREWKDTEGLEKEVLSVQNIVKRLMEGKSVMAQEITMAQAFCTKASRAYLGAASWLIIKDREGIAAVPYQC